MRDAKWENRNGMRNDSSETEQAAVGRVYCMQFVGRVGMAAPLVADITFKFAL